MEINKQLYKAMNQDRRLPIPWLSPECFTECVFSHKSDIWAVGITIWEFCTQCKIIPYVDELNGQSFKDCITSGKILNQPDSMTDCVYELCKKCWQTDPENRPNGRHLLIMIPDIYKNAVKFDSGHVLLRTK